MRLDDWVLCRVRYKDYSSNHRGEIQEKCASKLNLPTITDYHQMLASVVLGDEPNKLPCDNMTGMNFRSSKGNSFSSVSPQMTTIPSLDNFSCFDSLKRMSNEDSQRGLNLISFNSGKPNPENYEIDNVTDTNCYSQRVCNEGSLGQRIVDSGIHFQELNELTFPGRFMQCRNE
ncbi:hypothetical protein K1719_041833 [Acacia pycnantha]|nr:hypothetical protein K1719_041833 [Acacia pycnantha]